MNKRIWILATVTFLLAGAYVVFFTDWLNPTPISILTELRAPMSRFGMGRGGGPGGGGGAGGGRVGARNGGNGDNGSNPEAGARTGRNRRNGQGGGARPENGGGGGGGGGAERGRRQGGGAGGANGGEAPVAPTVYAVSFAFDDSYPITSIKVVKVVKSGTAPVLWSLVNDGEPRGTKALVYGMPVKGMKLAPNYKRAEPLEAGVEYEVQVAAGRHKGKATFHTKELPPPEEPTAAN